MTTRLLRLLTGRNIIALGILLVAVFFLRALTFSLPSAAQETATPVAALQAQASTNPEADALRVQVEAMRDFDQRFLQTVYWALGGVVAICVLVFGFLTVGQLRIYDRDKDALQRALEAKLREEAASLRNGQGDTEQRLSKDIRGRFEQIEANLADSVRNLEQITAESRAAVMKDVTRQLADLQTQQRSLRLELSLLEAKYWMLQNVPLNTLMVSIGILQEALADPMRHSAEMDEGFRLLREAVEAARGIPDYYHKDASAVLQRLPPEYLGVSNELLGKMRPKLQPA